MSSMSNSAPDSFVPKVSPYFAQQARMPAALAPLTSRSGQSPTIRVSSGFVPRTSSALRKGFGSGFLTPKSSEVMISSK